MKRTLLLLLGIITSIVMMAGDVTPEAALERATQFMKQRSAQGHGPRRAPGAQPQLTMACRVSGLYVFNADMNGGYVVVSDDDLSVPILGYSDSGNIDPENMPENMRAWLQGYAEEIAYLRGARYEVRGAEEARGARYEVLRVNKAGRTDVPAMLQTHWTQNGPFAQKCVFDGTQCVTGCVATAMAQVMYYYQWPAETADKIPAYTSSDTYNIGATPAGTAIDWSNIQQDYGWYLPEGEEQPKYAAFNDVQANAVAELLYYCGTAVRMEYGTGASGASSTEIPFALTNYFNYNSSALLLNRDSYTADDWDEIIYHEISNGRPVLYSGMSTGGGHSFVCDGYNSTDGTYHINWGWQGQSNGFFVLSALDPNVQGIGGSSSTDGFNSQQDAVIGIQKPADSGEVSERVSHATGRSLQLINAALSENPTIKGNEVTITLTIKNNSINDYNEYLAVWLPEDETGNAYSCNIGAGQTVNYEYPIKLTPEKTTQYTVLFFNGSYLNTLGWTKELTVYPASVSKDISSFEWATFSSEYPLDFSGTGIEAYIVTGSSGEAIHKTAVNIVPANTGLVLNGAKGTYNIPVTLATTEDVSGNKMVAVPTDINLVKGTDGTENYVLSVQSDEVVFARINADAAIVKAGSAYLTLPEDVSAPWLSIAEGDDGTTGIEHPTLTLPEGEKSWYSLDGRRIEKPAKGLYIHHGKKVVIK